jgi:hypothetical protein
VNDENGDLADSHSILKGWKYYLSQLLNAHRISDVRQIEIHTSEPLIPDSSNFDYLILALLRLKLLLQS